MQLAQVARDRFARFRDEALQNEQQARSDLLQARKERDIILAREQRQADEFERTQSLHADALQQAGIERDQATERETRARSELVEVLKELEEQRVASQIVAEEGAQALRVMKAALDQAQGERFDALQNAERARSAWAEAREEIKHALLLVEQEKGAVAGFELVEEEHKKALALERKEVLARERRALADLADLKQAHDAALEQALEARAQAIESESSARVELDKACKERDDTIAREQQVLAQVELLERECEAGKQAREKMRFELNEALDSVRASDNEKSKTQMGLEAAQRALAAAEAEAEHVRERSVRDIAALSARNNALTDSMEKLRRKTVELEESLGQARLEAARASTEGAILQSSLADLTEARHQRDNELMSRDEELRKLKRDHASLAALNAAVDRLGKQNVALDEELTATRLRAENASIEAVLLQTSLSGAAQVRQKLEKELADKREEALKLQQWVDGLASEKGLIEVKLAAAQRYSKDQEEAVRTLTCEIEALRSQGTCNDSSAEVEMTAQQHDEKIKLRALTIQIETLSSQLVGTEQDVLKAKLARDQAVCGEEQARAEVLRLLAILRAKDDLLSSQQAETADSTGSIAVDHHIYAMKEQIASLKTRFATEPTGRRDERRSPEMLRTDETLSDHVAGASITETQDDSKAHKVLEEVADLKSRLLDVHAELSREKSARQAAVAAEQCAVAQLKRLTQATVQDRSGSAMEGLLEVELTKQGFDEGDFPRGFNLSGVNGTDSMKPRQDGDCESMAGGVVEDAAGIEMTLKLGLNFSAAGGEGSKARRLFSKSLVQDLASAADTPAACFRVLSMSPGSVMVTLLVRSGVATGPDPARIIEGLQSQVVDSDSQLMKGILTRYTLAISLSGDMQVRVARRPGDDVDFPAEEEVDAWQDLRAMTQSESSGNDRHLHRRFEHDLAAKDAQLYLLHRQIEGKQPLFPEF